MNEVIALQAEHVLTLDTLRGRVFHLELAMTRVTGAGLSPDQHFSERWHWKEMVIGAREEGRRDQQQPADLAVDGQFAQHGATLRTRVITLLCLHALVTDAEILARYCLIWSAEVRTRHRSQAQSRDRRCPRPPQSRPRGTRPSEISGIPCESIWCRAHCLRVLSRVAAE